MQLKVWQVQGDGTVLLGKKEQIAPQVQATGQGSLTQEEKCRKCLTPWALKPLVYWQISNKWF